MGSAERNQDSSEQEAGVSSVLCGTVGEYRKYNSRSV